MDSSGEKPRRRWFRLRFGLRTLLLFVTAVAVWLSYETRRAQNQEALVARVEAMGGQCQRVPREWIPLLVQGLLSENQGCFVEGVALEAMQAPGAGPQKLFEPADMEALLRMPGMAEVCELACVGTAFTDDVLDELAMLRGLQSVTFGLTAVTEKAVRELEASLPHCSVEYSAEFNGSAQLVFFHGEALSRTDDLRVFVRASRGDPDAIKVLLDTVGEDTGKARRHALLARFFRQIDRQALLPLVADALRNGSLETRLLAVKTLADHEAIDSLGKALQDPETSVRLEAVANLVKIGKAGATAVGSNACRDLLAEALHDPEAPVRLEVLYGLVEISGDEAAAYLTDACCDEDAKVRAAAIWKLSPIAGRDALSLYLTALKDPEVDVRWQAIRAIGNDPDEEALTPLIDALHDKSASVRCAAARVLGKIGDPSAIPSLETAAEEEDPLVRKAAKVALAKVAAELEE